MRALSSLAITVPRRCNDEGDNYASPSFYFIIIVAKFILKRTLAAALLKVLEKFYEVLKIFKSAFILRAKDYCTWFIFLNVGCKKILLKDD